MRPIRDVEDHGAAITAARRLPTQLDQNGADHVVGERIQHRACLNDVAVQREALNAADASQPPTGFGSHGLEVRERTGNTLKSSSAERQVP